MQKSSGDFDKRCGALLKLKRIEVGLSQQALGEALGITFQQVQKYENGTNRLSAARLNEAASLLGVAPSYFFPKCVAKGARSSSLVYDLIVSMVSHPETFDMFRAFLSIKDAAKRKDAIKIIRTIANAVDGTL